MALPGGYRGGARTNTLGSWADINVLVPGTQGDLVRGARSPQSARSDVGWAANATPMANTAVAVSITFRRYIPQASLRLDLMRRARGHHVLQVGMRRARGHHVLQVGMRWARRHHVLQVGMRRARRHHVLQVGMRRARRHDIRRCKSGTSYRATGYQSN